MAQQQSPWLEGAYGWSFGEGGWNTGMDQNLLKFSFMFDRNIDSIVASLPAAINGQAHYLTTDNRLYFAVGTTYFSTPTPKWFIVVLRGTGQTYQFNGTSLVQIDSPQQLDSRIDAVELTVSTLGTAAFQTTEFFASKAQLDVSSAQTGAYTDTLRNDIANTANPLKGAGQVGRSAQVVSSIAALRLLDKAAASKHAFCTGYYANGDGGGGEYYLDTADTTSADNGGTIIVATDGGRWKFANPSAINIQTFGAKADGVTDDSVALQAYIDWLGVDGGVMQFPAGQNVTVKFNSKLSFMYSNITIEGNGCTIIPPSAVNGFEFFNAGGQQQFARIRNFRFQSPVIRTAGACIKFLNWKDVEISSCRFTNQFDCIELALCLNSRVTSCVCDEWAGRFLLINGSETTSVTNCATIAAAVRVGSVGIQVVDGGGIYITGCDFVRGEKGLALEPVDAAHNVRWVFISNSSFDTGTYGMWASAGLGKINSVHSSNSWYSSNTVNGALLINVDGVSFSNDRVLQNHTDGLFFSGTSKNITIDHGTVVADNGVALTNTYSGAVFEANTDYISVHGQFLNGYAGSAVSQQKFGVNTAASTLGNFEITGARFKGMLSGNVLFSRDITKNCIVEKNISDSSQSIASATTITIDNTIDICSLTGTTAVQNVNLHTKGKRLTIVLQAANTIQNGFNFSLAGNFTGNAGSTLDLISDGQAWRETGRLVL